MTEYTHRITVIVGARQLRGMDSLAQIIGQSEDDINTFSTPNYQDAKGAQYTVCSFVGKPAVLKWLGHKIVPADVLAHASRANIAMAQRALDSVILYDGETTISRTKVTVAVDIEPSELFDNVGLTPITSELD